VLARLDEVVKGATPEAGAGIYVDEIAAAVSVEGGANVISNVIYNSQLKVT
jgi:isoaspartyl peptidase/L-asparaginase-like protein (Ntn-hydrolase superfamily)